MMRSCCQIMVVRVALLFVILATTKALQPPELPPTSSVNVNVNVPALFDLVKTREARRSTLDKAMFLGQSAKYLVGPDTVSVDPPSDIKGFVRQALRGHASVTIDPNLRQQPPQKVDVQILASDWGALTIQIRNPLVPKLPLVGLPDTPPIVSNMVGPVVTEAAPGALSFAQRVWEKYQAPPSPPFWETPIRDGTVAIDVPSIGFHRAVTPLDILGTSSLVLGAAYAGSYAYYVAEQEQEARQAEDRKKAMAAKRAAAAAAAPPKKEKQDDKTATNKKQAAGKGKSEKKVKKEQTVKPNEIAEPVKAVEIKPEKKIERVENVKPSEIVVPVAPAAKKETVTTTPTTETTPPVTAPPTSTAIPVKTPVATATPPAKQEVVLLSAPQPQLQRSVPRDKSIALAQDDEIIGEEDEDLIPEPTTRRFRIFGIFKRLFRRKDTSRL